MTKLQKLLKGWRVVGYLPHVAGMGVSNCVAEIVSSQVLVVAPKMFQSEVRKVNADAKVVTPQWLVRHPDISEDLVLVMWGPTAFAGRRVSTLYKKWDVTKLTNNFLKTS